MFFSFEKLQQQSKGDPTIMLNMLENFYYDRIPKNKFDFKNFSKVNLAGTDFLLNPKTLFSAKVDVRYKVQYLILAAKRDYLFYKIYEVKYLDLSYFPDLDISKIRGNPLLEVIENKLYFKYEGNTHG